MALRLYFLGSPRLERDGRPVETDTRKAVALLAYLAVTGAYQTRDTLAALLWPEMDAERARAALRRTLSAVRAAVGDEVFFVSRDGLSLNADHVWCDVTDFQAAVSAAERAAHAGSPPAQALPELEAAVALYRDHFLSGFSLRDSAEFDEWQLAVAERLRRAYTMVLGRLVHLYSQSGDLERAIELGRRWLAVDPLREEAHRWLMQLYTWNGARDAALRQYRDVVRLLDEELGVGPLPETTTLYEAIQAGRLAPPAEPPPPPATQVVEAMAESAPLTLPLIGRDAAWELLQQVYGEVEQVGRVAAVVGEAGIGKTRLVDTFLDHAQHHQAITVAVTCYEGEANLAYASITAALRALAGRRNAAERLAGTPSHWLSEAARLVPELADAVPMATNHSALPGAQARFFAGVSETLCHLLNGSVPSIFFLDDAHWADEASLDLLAYLMRRQSELPILLILAWSDTVGEAPRLRRLISEAQRAETGRLITLTRWRPSDVFALVANHENLRARAAEITDRLYRETEGLPYFVIEYLAALNSQSEPWTMPQSIRDLLAGRLADVAATGRQLLQTAAAIGRSFDYTTLWEASGRSEDEVVAGLEELLARGLIRELPASPGGAGPSDDVRYDFAHEQVRALVYNETNLARRRLLHRRVAASLHARARGPQAEAIAGMIGDHYLLGGQDATAADFFRAAGDHARALFANREALAHYRTALALGHAHAAALHEAAGDLHTLLGEYQAALQAYEAAAAQADPADLGRLEHRIGQVYERRANWESAGSHYCAALEHYHDLALTVELARLNVDRSRVAYFAGDLAAARSLAEEALAQSAGDEAAEAQAHNTLGLLARQEGRPDEARSHLERSLALAGSAGLAAAQVAALNNLARLREAAGQREEALALLDEALALCARQGDRHREAALHNHRADILHRAGQEEAAMASLKQAVAIYAEIGMESGDWQPEIWKLTEW